MVQLRGCTLGAAAGRQGWDPTGDVLIGIPSHACGKFASDVAHVVFCTYFQLTPNIAMSTFNSEDDDEKQPTGQYDDDDSEEEVTRRKSKVSSPKTH